jgi:hypothetical protein
MGFINCTGTTNCGQELTKIAIKLKTMSFFVIPLKHVPSVMGLVNCPRTLKKWAIAQENDDKNMKIVFLYMPLKHVPEYLGPCKSSWKPKTMGNNSRKQP